MNKNANRLIVLVAAMVTIFFSVFAIALSMGYNRPGSASSESSSAQAEKARYFEPSSSLSSSSSSLEEPEEPEPFDRDVVRILVCGIDDTEMLTDVIMLVQIDLAENSAQVLQIPRDSFVGYQVPTGKINAVYSHGGGIEGVASAVKRLTAITPDYYITVTLEGLRNIVNSLGGVEVTIPFEMDYLPGKVLEAGTQTLNGEKAEWFIRYRAGYASGDLGRIDAHKLFATALMEKVKAMGRFKSLAALSQNYKYVSTDIPLPKMLSLANEAFMIEPASISYFTVPGYGVFSHGYAVYGINRMQLAEILNKNFRGENAQVSPWKLYINDPEADE